MAMRENVDKDAIRQRHEAAYRFMTALAGDLPVYEEARGVLFANNREGTGRANHDWPADVKRFTMQLRFSDVSDMVTCLSACTRLVLNQACATCRNAAKNDSLGWAPASLRLPMKHHGQITSEMTSTFSCMVSTGRNQPSDRDRFGIVGEQLLRQSHFKVTTLKPSTIRRLAIFAKERIS